MLSGCVGGQLGKHNSNEYRNGMVVSASPLASKVGLGILKKVVTRLMLRLPYSLPWQ
ncbi:hypothetical protein [Pedobacter panaciterrae]